ncbi:uncharacterized protein E6C27_scaffold46G004530 [Cucumis melo var. makuwa]|uniref:Uncharacterized protein n=1 Tax=Cucumis melo var. makuwa TaxID=1194695 RepID=A0A5A7TS58_CUCMM|nr:uncharacterized protein E6C27_scaffold46G004530 [Cucumis melo var. makuwa]
MAANSRSAGAIAGLGKRITDQIWTSSDSLRNSVISSSAPKFRFFFFFFFFFDFFLCECSLSCSAVDLFVLFSGK